MLLILPQEEIMLTSKYSQMHTLVFPWQTLPSKIPVLTDKCYRKKDMRRMRRDCIFLAGLVRRPGNRQNMCSTLSCCDTAIQVSVSLVQNTHMNNCCDNKPKANWKSGKLGNRYLGCCQVFSYIYILAGFCGDLDSRRGCSSQFDPCSLPQAALKKASKVCSVNLHYAFAVLILIRVCTHY